MSGYDDTGSYGDRKRGVPAALVQGDGDAGSTVEWSTPDPLFDALDAEFGPFTMDPATSLGFHTSDVILARGGRVITLGGAYERVDHGCSARCSVETCTAPDCVWSSVDLVEDEDGSPLPGDGLHEANPWTGRVWLNHPYGRNDWRWMKKAHDSVRFGDAEIVVALVPVKTQMKWWAKYVGATEISVSRELSSPSFAANPWRIADIYPAASGADVIRFIRGRLRFGGAPSSAPFNSAIVVWRK